VKTSDFDDEVAWLISRNRKLEIENESLRRECSHLAGLIADGATTSSDMIFQLIVSGALSKPQAKP
jgi:hypothetical protein